MGNDTILQRFLCSLGNHLILPVVCRFFLVLENFVSGKGYSFRELSALTAGGSPLAAVPGVAQGHPGLCSGARTAERANLHPSESCPSSPSRQMLRGCVRAALPLWEVMRRG